MSTETSEKPEPSPFERIKSLGAQVVSVPKSEVAEREKEWRAKKNEKKSSHRD